MFSKILERVASIAAFVRLYRNRTNNASGMDTIKGVQSPKEKAGLPTRTENLAGSRSWQTGLGQLEGLPGIKCVFLFLFFFFLHCVILSFRKAPTGVISPRFHPTRLCGKL